MKFFFCQKAILHLLPLIGDRLILMMLTSDMNLMKLRRLYFGSDIQLFLFGVRIFWIVTAGQYCVVVISLDVIGLNWLFGVYFSNTLEF